jgi:hypothetical protein
VPTGFTNLAPAVKWQISPMPKVDLSAVVGIGLPIGTSRLVGPGSQPYVQFPWSWEISELWAVNGMFTAFVHTSDLISKEVSQSTFVLERKLGQKAAVFLEWIGEFPSNAPAGHLFNSGAIYRLSNNEQIDFASAQASTPKRPASFLG